jgi:Mce-associated membrane protein
MTSKAPEAEAVLEPAESVEETETAPAEEIVEDERKPRRNFKIKINDRLVTIVAIVVALLAIGTAGIQWTKAEQNGAELATENKVRMRVTEFMLAFFNYDHNHLDQWQKRMTELSTSDYSKKVLVSFTGFDKSIVELKTVSVGTVRDSYVAKVDGSNAKAFVVVDSQAKSTPGTLFRTGMKLMLSLVEQKGEWKVNELTAIGADTENWLDPNGKPMQSPVLTTESSASPSPSAGATP